MDRRWSLALGAVVLGAGALATAQVGRPVLHEDLPPPGASDGPLVGDTPRPGRNPAGFSSGQKILPEPPLEAPAAPEPVLGRGGFAADRATETRPTARPAPTAPCATSASSTRTSSPSSG